MPKSILKSKFEAKLNSTPTSKPGTPSRSPSNLISRLISGPVSELGRQTFRLSIAFLLVTIAATTQPASRLLALPTPASGMSGQSTQKATLKAAAAKTPDIPFDDFEPQSEAQLLALANLSRKQAGAPPLLLDAGLSQAARIHALAMLEANELSHQFGGELSLPLRLAATTDLQLDQEGENVALDYDAAHGHEHLMLSPPHRANLLNPDYNVVGLGVVRSGERLFIVQDFGHALPKYSPAEVKDRIAAALGQARHQIGQRELQRRDLLTADDAACSMAKADKLGTSSVRQFAQRSTVLTYTSLHPETLPAEAAHAMGSRTLHTFSIGACYSRTETYPTGVYWVVLSME
jgi:uncharacterized protein YkwD